MAIGSRVRRHEAVQDREARKGGDGDPHHRHVHPAGTWITIGTSSTTPISKKSGSPRIAAIRAMAQGSPAPPRPAR